MQKYDGNVASKILKLTEAQQRLAEVQRRLDENLGAWAALTHALALLHSPVLAQAIENEHYYRAKEYVQLRPYAYIALVHQIKAADFHDIAQQFPSSLQHCLHMCCHMYNMHISLTCMLWSERHDSMSFIWVQH